MGAASALGRDASMSPPSQAFAADDDQLRPAGLVEGPLGQGEAGVSERSIAALVARPTQASGAMPPFHLDAQAAP
jgi:hypothetical protein